MPPGAADESFGFIMSMFSALWFGCKAAIRRGFLRLRLCISWLSIKLSMRQVALLKVEGVEGSNFHKPPVVSSRGPVYRTEHQIIPLFFQRRDQAFRQTEVHWPAPPKKQKELNGKGAAFYKQVIPTGFKDPETPSERIPGVRKTTRCSTRRLR